MEVDGIKDNIASTFDEYLRNGDVIGDYQVCNVGSGVGTIIMMLKHDKNSLRGA